MRTEASRTFMIALPAVAAAVLGGAALTGDDGGSAAAAASTTTQTAACRSEEVSVVITDRPMLAHGTTRVALLALTNTGTAPCAVRGWATIRLTGARGHEVPVSTTEVPLPGPATRFDLAPGASAYAGMKWTLCPRTELDCSVGRTLGYSLAATGDGLPAQLKGFPAEDLTMGTLRVGSLQPVAAGADGW